MGFYENFSFQSCMVRVKKLVLSLFKVIGGSACIGVGLKLITFLNQDIRLPFFPNIVDYIALITVGIYLVLKAHIETIFS